MAKFNNSYSNKGDKLGLSWAKLKISLDRVVVKVQVDYIVEVYY